MEGHNQKLFRRDDDDLKRRSYVLHMKYTDIAWSIFNTFEEAEQINSSDDFEVCNIRTNYVKKTADYNVTQCTNCPGEAGICHEKCKFTIVDDKASCVAINKDGYCNRCPKHCHWKDHVNSKEYYERERTKEKWKMT